MPDARAVVFPAVGSVALADVAVPDPGPGEVQVRAAYTGVSPGTELRCLAGLQHGAPPFPFIPGYAMSGTVEAVGPGVTLPVGARVVGGGTARVIGANRLWGGHLSHAVRRAEEWLVVPDGVDLRDAALAPLAAIAYHGLRLARPLPHETVACLGLGPIGQLAARLYHAAGARVIAADLSETRTAAARAVGIDARTLAPGATLAALFADVLANEGGADILVDATGSPRVLADAIPLARPVPWVGPRREGGVRYILQGSYPDTFVVPYGPFFDAEASLIVPRDRQPVDVRAVLDLMARGRFTVADLLTGDAVRPPGDAPAVYAELKTGGPLAAVFRWG